jgi:hypothetical protein
MPSPFERAAVLIVLILGIGAPGTAFAACAFPNNLANGQLADAAQVMGNFDAVTGCIVANGTVNNGSAGQVGTYSTAGTVISGQALTNLLDNSFGSAQGSLLYRDTAGWAILSPGSAGQVLTSTGGALEWSNGGAGSGSFKLFSDGTAAGTGNDNTEDTLHTYTLPANMLSIPGQVIRITAGGSFAANSHTKAVKFYFGSTSTAMNTGATGTNVSWRITADIIKSGANSQVILFTLWEGPNSGNVSTVVLATHIFATQNDSAPIILKTTGQVTGTVTANDVVNDFMLAEFIP